MAPVRSSDQSLLFKSREILFRSQEQPIIVILTEADWAGEQFYHFLICLSKCQLSLFIIFIGFPKTGYLDITGVCHDIQNFTNNPILFFNTLFILGQTLVRLELIKN